MAGHYNKRKTVQKKNNLLAQSVLVFVVFIAGYFSASVYDLATLTHWVGSHFMAKNSALLTPPKAVARVELPKPKLEFYTLLANEHIEGASTPPKNSSTMTLDIAKTTPLNSSLAPVERLPAAVVNPKDAYLVQVASFKTMQDAERMKVTLVMKGFDVKIAKISQQGSNWYRVIIGPFASRTKAQQAQQAFARQEHILGMIRKMDA